VVQPDVLIVRELGKLDQRGMRGVESSAGQSGSTLEPSTENVVATPTVRGSPARITG
jgi:hypothetical protein